MNAWQNLAERLVELDLEIEDRDGWATRPEDVEELQELEAQRDQVRGAVARHYIPQALRRRLENQDHSKGLSPLTHDPRD